MKKIIFCGMLVLTCCLFKEAEIVEAGKTYNISGKCIPMSLSFGDKITANDACIAAGYGSCASVSGSYLGFTTCSNCEINALGLHGFPDPITGCNMVITNVGGNECIKIDNLVCNMRSWGIIPQPDNVPGDFEQSIKNATDWILGFVGMIAVLMLIWGGIGYLTSAGDEDKAKTGKKTLTYAIIGLVLAGIAYAIVDVIITVIL